MRNPTNVFLTALSATDIQGLLIVGSRIVNEYLFVNFVEIPTKSPEYHRIVFVLLANYAAATIVSIMLWQQAVLAFWRFRVIR